MTLLMQMTQITLRYFDFYLPNVCLFSTHSSTDNHHAQRLESTNAFTVSYSNWIQSTWKSRKTIIINSASHIRSDVELGVSVNALSSWYWQKTMSRRLEKRSVTRKISKRYAEPNGINDQMKNACAMRIHNPKQHQFDYVSFITCQCNRIGEMARTIRRRVLRCVHRCWCPSTPFTWVRNVRLSPTENKTIQHRTEDDCIYFPFFSL